MLISGPKFNGVSPYFNGQKFVNRSGASAHGFSQVIRWMLHRKRQAWRRVAVEAYGPKPPERDTSRITFIGHSTFLIQVDGLNILTDPVLSRRASPFDWIGPKRMRPPGIRFKDLPPIDYVLISHNHYDHLDQKSILKLMRRFQPTFITPLGVDTFIKQIGIEKVFALDWWQQTPLQQDLDVVAVPAQHFSGRGMLDRDATLWCGYVLRRSAGNIYFAGDTGYDQIMFKEIGESFSIKLSLIPIGAYMPEWFMSPVHISPAEAVQVHQDLHAEQSIAMHFGTFPLGDEGQQQAPSELRKELHKKRIPEKAFLVMNEGEHHYF